MLPSSRSLPLLLILALAVLVAVAVPGASPLAGVVVAAGLLHRLAVCHHRRAPVPVAAPAAAPAIP
ncbi:hypothetical protein SAMN03159343_3253 [Klenkia marina]|uniref:Uncharacterized protein n=1 Tax=Klenkia marina TaxID=1960309 RepID=A0A1G4YPE9_9ACTN|nr:hypothetical protein [Klenkia marina]SCX55356.1 hypothetical protein SAMN03159343_3253 [Klenkia marina]